MVSRSKVYFTISLVIQNEHCYPGITGGYGGDRRVEHIIPPKAVRDGHYSVVIESSCNGMFGVPWNGDTIAPPDVNLFSFQHNADTHFYVDEQVFSACNRRFSCPKPRCLYVVANSTVYSTETCCRASDVGLQHSSRDRGHRPWQHCSSKQGTRDG